jgi:hypothetical protein
MKRLAGKKTNMVDHPFTPNPVCGEKEGDVVSYIELFDASR